MFNNIDDIFSRARSEEHLGIALGLHIYTIQRWRKTGIPFKYWKILIKKYGITPAELYSINQNILRGSSNGNA